MKYKLALITLVAVLQTHSSYAKKVNCNHLKPKIPYGCSSVDDTDRCGEYKENANFKSYACKIGKDPSGATSCWRGPRCKQGQVQVTPRAYMQNMRICSRFCAFAACLVFFGLSFDVLTPTVLTVSKF